VIGIRPAAERGNFAVAVTGVQPPGFGEVTAGVQPQRGYLVPACMLFQAVKEPGAEPPAAGRGNHEDAGDLSDVTGQQAQPGAPQHASLLARHQQQAARRCQVVAGIFAHGRGDLVSGRRAAVVPAGNVVEVCQQDPARFLRSRGRDRDSNLRVPAHHGSMPGGASQ
jgi:hypothetical protein